jgi:hypothetical protein
MSGVNSLQTESSYEEIYFYSCIWLPVYTSFCILGSIPLLAITMPLGLSVADDVVFGALVVVGGPLGDFAFRKIFRRVMLLVGKVQIIWAWPIIGVLVMILQPLE